MKYLNHLRELRNRILFSFLFLFLSFIYFFFNVSYVGEILTKPLFSLLADSPNQRMIFTSLPEVFVSNLKISLFAAFLISIPVLLIQLMLFISPALYKNEKKFFIPLVLLSPLFFLAGILFAYYFLIPVIWNFFITYENLLNNSFPVELESKYSEYVRLIMFLLFASGLSFEFPVLIILLTKIGVFNHHFLSKNRKFFFIGILIFSAIFTPPDVISQIGIAIPLIIFYEFSILFIKFFINKKNA